MRALGLALCLSSAVLAHGTRSKPTPAPEGDNAKPGAVAGHVRLVDKDGPHPAEGAVVYIEDLDPSLWKAERRKPAPAETPAVTMKAKKFAPRVLPVVAGTEVAFPNLDPVFHNVFSLSGKNRFDLGLYKDGASKTKAFKEPGLVRVYCNIHPWMTATVLVVPNPWFAVPGADGAYTIPGVPPGTHTVKVWHERGGETSSQVEVRAGEAADADFELDASGFKELPHKNKFGQEYGKPDAY